MNVTCPIPPALAVSDMDSSSPSDMQCVPGPLTGSEDRLPGQKEVWTMSTLFAPDWPV